MATINLDHQLVLDLRAKTGAGFLDCQKVLRETNGDLTKAVEILRKKGLATAASKMGRVTKEGVIYAYIHHGGKIGVMIELNCETDFVARTEDFQNLAKELAMQVAAANPRWVRKEDVPGDIVTKEKEIYAEQAKASGKPPQAIEKMLEGKLQKFYSETCLVEQASVRDTSGKTKVSDTVAQVSAKVGENIIVRRFSRFQVGEEI